jgi:membrane-associated phospholipid phosphatase
MRQDNSSSRRILIFWLFGITLYSLDFCVKLLPLWRSPINIALPIDHRIPFEPIWAWIYLPFWLFFLFVGSAYALWRMREHTHYAYQFLAGGTIMQLGGWSIQFLFPAYMPSPELPIAGGASTWLMRQIYEADPPTHVFPSLHVASTVLVAYFLQMAFSNASPATQRASWLACTAAILLVALSTLFTKQHGVLDVGAGLLWGYLSGAAGMHFGMAWRRYARAVWAFSTRWLR